MQQSGMIQSRETSQWKNEILSFIKTQFDFNTFIDGNSKYLNPFNNISPQDIDVVILNDRPVSSYYTGFAFEQQNRTFDSEHCSLYYKQFETQLKELNFDTISNTLSTLIEKTKCKWLWLNVCMTFSNLDNKFQVACRKYLSFWEPVICKIVQDILSQKDCVFVLMNRNKFIETTIKFTAEKFKRQCVIIYYDKEQNLFKQIQYVCVNLPYNKVFDYVSLKFVDI